MRNAEWGQPKSMQTLKLMAEGFRTRATAIEAKHGKETWVQTVNVIAAFEQCAEELEAFLAAQDVKRETGNVREGA